MERPVAVAVDPQNADVCILEGYHRNQEGLLLCYPTTTGGDVSPSFSLNLDTLGLGALGGLTFDRNNDFVVWGWLKGGNRPGVIMVVSSSQKAGRRVKRAISGPHTGLPMSIQSALEVIGTKSGSIIALAVDSSSRFLSFAPSADGDAEPIWTRSPNEDVPRPHDLAGDLHTGAVAILGAKGVAVLADFSAPAEPRWSKNVWAPSDARHPVDVAFSNRGVLAVADNAGGVRGYSGAHSSKTVFTDTNGAFSLLNPSFITTDVQGRIYLSSESGDVTIFAPGAEASSVPTGARKFVTGDFPTAFAADDDGYLYLSFSRHNAVVVLDPSNRQLMLHGPSTGLHNPKGLAVGSDGLLYVANEPDDSVLIFRRGSHGDVPPVARVAGPNTELHGPRSVALDASGKLIVYEGTVSSGRSRILAYDAGAHTDTHPSQTYSVQPKCFTVWP